MNDLYDVITVLRQKHMMSLRMLALKVNFAPTTLASVMSRRPPTIDKELLIRIAGVFDVKWVELLNKPDSYAEECLAVDRIPVEMSPEDIDAVRQKLIGPLEKQMFARVSESSNTQSRGHGYVNPHVGENGFRQGFMFVLNKLNDNGLMEAMKRVIEIAEDPKFRRESGSAACTISTDHSVKKEETEGQEEEQ